MLFKASTAVAVLAVAAQAAAEPQPYKASNTRHFMSARQIFGLGRRTDDGYSPSQSYCGMGSTCADACGAGYETCASSDSAIHCYDPTASQICCPDDSGNSCDSGYYCAGSSGGDTICCPDDQTLEECASSYGVTGSLTSETATPTATSTLSSVSSTSVPATTTFSSSSSSVATVNSTTSTPVSTSTSSLSYANLTAASNTTITTIGTGYTTVCSATALSTSTFASNNVTTTAGSPAATSTEEVIVSGAGLVQPANAFAALVFAVFALVL